MKKFFIYSFFFILVSLSGIVFYLSFFGYETDKFNQIIKTEINNKKKDFSFDFEKVSILLDVKTFTLFVKLLKPEVEYKSIKVPIKTLRANVDLKSLIKDKVSIYNVEIETNFIELNSIKKRALDLPNVSFYKDYLNKIIKSKFKISSSFNLNENYKVKNFILSGEIKNTDYAINSNYKITNIKLDFVFKDKIIKVNSLSANLNHAYIEDGLITVKNQKSFTNMDIETSVSFNKDILKLPVIKKTFKKDEVYKLKTELNIYKNGKYLIKAFSLNDNENMLKVDNLSLNKNFQIQSFKSIKVKTKDENKINNNFKIENKESILIKGKIFDASILLKELDNTDNKNNFLKNISKKIEVDLNEVLTSTELPLNNFRLIGLIKKGKLEKISAKSEYSKNKFLDLSLNKDSKTGDSILEIYSDEAKPLVNSYKFFEGLAGGSLIFVSKSNKNNTLGNLSIENFKLNKAPGFAKLLSLADLRGLTDALKGEGITFDKLSINYQSTNDWMEISEIFLIGPSISILVEGYFDKKKDILSLRGTLVPAKTLNSLVSKIPVIGDILIGKKSGDGLFGVSFKIKGPTDNLKTSVNPVKTLTPRFITRTLDELKKKNSK